MDNDQSVKDYLSGDELTNIEALRMKNYAVLRGMINHQIFKLDEANRQKLQEKVDARQKIVFLPTEHGIEEYRDRDRKVASLCEYFKITEKPSQKDPGKIFEVQFRCLSLCVVTDITPSTSSYYVNIHLLPEQPIDINNSNILAQVEKIQNKFKEYLSFGTYIPIVTIENIKNPKSIDDLLQNVVFGAGIDVETRRALINETDPLNRLVILSSGLETRIFEQATEKGKDLISYYKSKLNSLNIDELAKKRIYLELSRLRTTKRDSAEYGNTIDWLDRVLSFPWNIETEDNNDLGIAENILNDSHYGLDKIKQRILDIIAIQRCTNKQPSQILCLYGPPGVGKSTIAKSIAKALNKNYYALSLGGVNKSEDIAGMKRFFVGAKPGKVIEGITQAGSNNCVILLDEIDKMSTSNNHSDPAAVLMEVLDRNQNNSFKDSYFEIPMDLSKVFFIATANNISRVPEPLLNRLEIMKLDGYSVDEKVHIVNKYIIKQVTKEFGLERDIISLSPETIEAIIEQYTFESGVRQLENIIREICRKHIAYKSVSGEPIETTALSINDINQMIDDFYEEEDNMAHEDEIGVVNKMSVKNDNIGNVCRLEAAITDGVGELVISDNLVGTAKSTFKTVDGLLRYRATDWQIPKEIFSDHNIYVHSPIHEEKHSGSSGGVADVICILSAIKNVPVLNTIAFTGAITLKGRIMGIGGIKEKVLAAQRKKIKTIVLPMANMKDVEKLSSDVVGNIEFKYFENMDGVYDYIFR